MSLVLRYRQRQSGVAPPVPVPAGLPGHDRACPAVLRLRGVVPRSTPRACPRARVCVRGHGVHACAAG
jgi:hypothetical protein